MVVPTKLLDRIKPSEKMYFTMWCNIIHNVMYVKYTRPYMKQSIVSVKRVLCSNSAMRYIVCFCQEVVRPNPEYQLRSEESDLTSCTSHSRLSSGMFLSWAHSGSEFLTHDIVSFDPCTTQPAIISCKSFDLLVFLGFINKIWPWLSFLAWLRS